MTHGKGMDRDGNAPEIKDKSAQEIALILAGGPVDTHGKAADRLDGKVQPVRDQMVKNVLGIYSGEYEGPRGPNPQDQTDIFPAL